MGDEVLYIGQTIRPIYHRLLEHKREQKFQDNFAKVYIAFCNSKEEMDLLERLLIAKYRPTINTSCKSSNVNIDFKEPQWMLYDYPYNEDLRRDMFDDDVSGTLCASCINDRCPRCPPSRIAAFGKILYRSRRKRYRRRRDKFASASASPKRGDEKRTKNLSPATGP